MIARLAAKVQSRLIFFFFPFVTNSIAHQLSPGDISLFHLLQTTCRVKAMLAYLEDKEEINFVGDG